MTGLWQQVARIERCEVRGILAVWLVPDFNAGSALIETDMANITWYSASVQRPGRSQPTISLTHRGCL